MSSMIHDMELAEKFLNGKMSDEEREKLATRLDKDENFNHLIQDMSTLVDGIKFTGSETTINEKIKKLKSLSPHDELFPMDREGKMVILFKRKLGSRQAWLALAASIAFFAIAWFTIFNRESLFGKPDLYAKYFEPFDSPGSGLTRGANDKLTIMAEAYEAYDAGNYSVAASLFEKALLEKDEAIVHLCLANAYMATNDFDKAELNLVHMLNQHTDLVTQTKWYLALAYLKQNKMEKARATLWEISNSSTYGEKAKRLIKDLD